MSVMKNGIYSLVTAFSSEPRWKRCRRQVRRASSGAACCRCVGRERQHVELRRVFQPLPVAAGQVALPAWRPCPGGGRSRPGLGCAVPGRCDRCAAVRVAP